MRFVLLGDLHFICIFIDAVKSGLLTLRFQSDIVRISDQIKLSPFCHKTYTLNAIFYSYTGVYFVETILWLNLLFIY